MVNSNRGATAQRAAENRRAAARKDRQRKQLIAAAVGIATASQPSKPTAHRAGKADLTGLAELPPSAYDAAGNPNAANAVPAKVDGAEVRKDGVRPEVSYVGAEFCPYCATERWALVAALNRFGRFTGLGTTRSADNDGNLPTLSFVDR